MWGEGRGGVKLGKLAFWVRLVNKCKRLCWLMVVRDFLSVVIIWHLEWGAVLVRPLSPSLGKGRRGCFPYRGAHPGLCALFLRGVLQVVAGQGVGSGIWIGECWVLAGAVRTAARKTGVSELGLRSYGCGLAHVLLGILSTSAPDGPFPFLIVDWVLMVGGVRGRAGGGVCGRVR